MKITQKRLKEIIAEEVQKLDETFGRHMAGETDRTAAAMQDSEAGQKWLEVSGMIYQVAREDLEMLVTAIRGLPMNAKDAIRKELAPRDNYTDTPSQQFQEALNRKNKKRK